MSDDTYLSTQDLVDMDLMQMFTNVDIVHSQNIEEAVQKEKTKLNEEVVRLLLTHPQTDETKAKLECVLYRVRCLDVRCKLFNYKSISLDFFFPIRICE